MNRSDLTRGTRWCQACSTSLSSLEVIREKTLPPKTIFLYLVTSPTNSIRLTANLRAQIDSGTQAIIWLSYNPASYYSYRDNCDFLRK